MKINIKEEDFYKAYFSNILEDLFLYKNGAILPRYWGEDYIIEVPRWSPDGSGRELEEARDFLKSIGYKPTDDELEEETLPEIAQRVDPKGWRVWKDVEREFAMSEFAFALRKQGYDVVWIP